MIIEFLSLWIFLILATSAVAVGIGLCAAKIKKFVEMLKEVRFIDNRDGTVLDTKTGLVWLKSALFFEYSWDRANEIVLDIQDGYFQGLTDGSKRGDWRLPTVEELTAVLDYSRWGMALPSDLSELCDVKSANHWTGTTYAHLPEQAWFVSLTSGRAGHSDKLYEYFVWPVKGGRRG